MNRTTNERLEAAERLAARLEAGEFPGCDAKAPSWKKRTYLRKALERAPLPPIEELQAAFMREVSPSLRNT